MALSMQNSLDPKFNSTKYFQSRHHMFAPAHLSKSPAAPPIFTRTHRGGGRVEGANPALKRKNHQKEGEEEDQLDGWASQGGGTDPGKGGAAEQITSWEKGSFS
jgi:hypothetical protein